MRALLDVNMLLALFDRGHVLHGRAMAWRSANKQQGWASCPLTQNGFLRIISQRAYQRVVPLAVALRVLRQQTAEPDHTFWPDDVSLTDGQLVDGARLLTSKQLTDVYLLALAVKHSGRLVTLDRGIPIAAVRGATAEHLVVV